MNPTEDDPYYVELTAQLKAVLAEGDSLSLEIASLAGQRARVHVEDSLQREAMQRVDLKPKVLHTALRTAATLLEATTVGAEAGEEPWDLWDRFCLLDELCAAAWWARLPEVAEPWVKLSTEVVGRYPATWAFLAPAASRFLRMTPLAADDPARPMWAAIEALTTSTEIP